MIKKTMWFHYKNLQLYLRLGLKLKNNTSRVKIQSITMAKTKCRIQHIKSNRSRRNGDKDRKALYKLMNNSVYGKAMENLRNRIGVKHVGNEKEYLK